MADRAASEAEGLKPCPFCGGETFGWTRPDGDTAVTCRDCGAVGPIEDSDHDAIAAWNTRPTPTTTGADEVERLVEELTARMAEASPQPWLYRPEHYDDWGWIRGVERDSDIGRYRPIVANAKNSDVGFDDMQAHRDAGTDPYGPNALLIVAAVNALPVLITSLRAADAVRREVG